METAAIRSPEFKVYEYYEQAAHNPHYFLPMVYTLDPHEEDLQIQKYGKPFPYSEQDSQYPYLSYITERWWDIETYGRLLFVEKSRQMLESWQMVALYLWDSIVKPNNYIYYRSEKLGKTGDKSNELSLLGRAIYIMRWLKYYYPEFLCHIWGKDYVWTEPKQSPLTLWRFPNGSTIHCVTNNPDDVRMYSANGALCDEDAFVTNVDEADAALMPQLGVKGRCTKITSANGGTRAERICKDLE